MNIVTNEQYEQTIKKYKGLIKCLVRSFNPRDDSEFNEYMQIARIAIWKALIKYDNKRACFSTIAWKYICWDIMRYLKKQSKHSHLVSLPDNEFDQAYQLDICEYLPTSLSEKEAKIITLKSSGMSLREICKQLGYPRNLTNKLFKTAIMKINEANK